MLRTQPLRSLTVLLLALAACRGPSAPTPSDAPAPADAPAAEAAVPSYPGDLAAYAANAARDDWDGRDRQSSFEPVRRRVHPSDRLPGLDADEVRALAGRELWGIELYRSNHPVAPPMFRSVRYLGGDALLVSTYAVDGGSAGLFVLDYKSGSLTPIEAEGRVARSVRVHQRVHFEQRDPVAGMFAHWLLVDQAGEADRRMLVRLAGDGELLGALPDLRPPAEDADFDARLRREAAMVSTRDPEGRAVVLVVGDDCTPQGPPLPAVEKLTYGRVPGDWTAGKEVVRPGYSDEYAIAVGELEDSALEDPRLYLPLGRDGRPLVLPEDCLGMARLVAFSHRDGTKVKPRVHPYAIVARGKDFHSGWALLREDEQGTYWELGGGFAEDVVLAAFAGELRRYRDWRPMNGFRVLFRLEGPARTEWERGELYVASVPPRAICERRDGRWEAFDMQRGVRYPLQTGDDVRDTPEDLARALESSDAALYDAVTGEAMPAYRELQQRRADAQAAAALQAQAYRDRVEAQRAEERERYRKWLERQRAADERARQEAVQSFSWDDLYATWRAQNLHREPRVEVHHEGQITRIVTYR